MKIYKAEKDLKDIILANNSLSFLLEPQKATTEDIERMSVDVNKIAKAGIADEDLYYHKSILVTTTWNGNDDVFLPEEVWAARNTPVHKPTNLNHESSKIVGHITGNWAIDADGALIDENTSVDSLPSKFHILTGSVIYKKFHNDPEYQDIVAELIEQIENKQQYVSMECSLKDFDYAIVPNQLEASSSVSPLTKIVARSADTAFLTKHLRVYGGTGIYEGYKIGRVLKNISFIGKAYTPKPANKESIIFTSRDIFDFANASKAQNLPFSDTTKKNSVVSNSIIDYNGENYMSDILQEQNKELKEKNVELASLVEDLKQQLAKADVQKYQDEIADLKSAVETSESEKKMKDEDMKKKEKAMMDYKSKAEELENTIADLNKQLESIKQERTFAQRVSTLVDNNIDKAVAEEKVKVFAFLTDEQFELISKELIEAANKSVESNKEKPAESSVADVDVNSSDVTDEEDSATAETVEETQEETETETETTVASLAKAFKTQLLRGDK